ncbi:hypothetical protein CHS0354_041199 [Potamilus streckersoni]|uniref:protein O-GlcNAcase n=1 Tax=Potamilus streckersoni TaxID=2493646 RepID=A0AAE0VV46_9BIVA|nr:hypothetical protein CHS0354_041199 [Potamilus streckersoni]
MKETSMTQDDDNVDNRNGSKFICGVVEGFYGRPWSTEQRKLLFTWMKKMSLTTYMYAPKDDCNHRAYWREPYSVEEAENLTSLIEVAKENNITFVYAISPGLDISFSSAKDVQFLKRKLEQVATFGCNAFALLFDDIDPELSEIDKSAFQSSAHAQASITNEVFEHLGQPEFFFCPTEYCTARAIPTLTSSGYLNTIGSKLLPPINIMWTGSKVVSKHIVIQEIEEVTAVIRRPPVIWDNIHANDYDPRRIYLGPYDGRSPEIIPYLRGVMTNPNCEFEANYIALHTMGQWNKSNAKGVKKDIITENRLSPVASDIKLETETDTEEGLLSLDTRYQPKLALRVAIKDWLEEFKIERKSQKIVTSSKPLIQELAQVPLIPTTPIVTPPVPVPPCSDTIPTDAPLTASTLPIENVSFLQPVTTALVNSLVDPSPSSSDTESEVSSTHDLEPMECLPSPVPGINSKDKEEQNLHKNPSLDSLMQVEVGLENKCDNVETSTSHENELVTKDDLELLISLFYLPFEYGTHATQMLNDLSWLRSNAFVVANSKEKGNDPELAEWMEKSKKFQVNVARINKLFDALNKIPNQSIMYYFFVYLWDLVGVLQSCNAYVQWLGLGHVPYVSVCPIPGPASWSCKEYRDAFSGGQLEPWCFRGGIQGEFQRLLPISGAHDLFYIRAPEQILKSYYRYRPYKLADESALYDICLKTCDDGVDGTEVFPDYPLLIGDRLIGSLVTLSPEYCFVVEDREGVCGYAVAALDTKDLQKKSEMSWIPAMCQKYPKSDKVGELTPAEELIISFHGKQRFVPEDVYIRFPSVIRLDVFPSRVVDPAMPKRLLACALAALKTSGSVGVHVELNVGDKCMADFYRMLGFFVLPQQASTDDVIYLGRLL